MMMTSGTAATRISSTSKRPATDKWRQMMNNAHLTPINLPMMSNDSPLRRSFLLRTEAKLLLKVRSFGGEAVAQIEAGLKVTAN